MDLLSALQAFDTLNISHGFIKIALNKKHFLALVTIFNYNNKQEKHMNLRVYGLSPVSVWNFGQPSKKGEKKERTQHTYNTKPGDVDVPTQ